MTWQKGVSGNPSGRPRADSAAGRAALRDTISKHLPAVIKKLIAQAKAGDVQAARTLLERVLPAVKPESLLLTLPDVAAAANPTEQATLIVKAATLGQVPPDVAGQLLAGIGQAARIAEIDELERRIRELEERAPR